MRIRQKKWRYTINIIVFITLSMLIFITPAESDFGSVSYSNLFSEKETSPKSKHFKLNKKNPPPPNAADDSFNSFYTIIFDDVYEPKDYHCLMYEQWVKDLKESDIVDGIEVYSLNAWKHPKCNLSTVTLPSPPTPMYDPTSWQLYQSLNMFLERSDSNWLFLIGDAAYLNVNKFLPFMQKVFTSGNNIYVKGGCIEYRYFFQMLELSSGIIMSREAVEKMVRLESHWNASVQIEMNGEQALGHAINNIGLSVPFQHLDGFIGNEFFQESDYDILESGDFKRLKKCFVRDELKNPFPGQTGNCVVTSQKLKDVLCWAGGGEKHRKEFLENVDEWISKLDDSVGIVWEKIHPKLCLL